MGTWKGRIVQRERTYNDYLSVTLIVTAHGLVSRFDGLTGAAHDSPTATSTCSVTYKLAGTKDGWFYYEQTGPSRMSISTSAVEGAPCGATGKRKPGWAGYLLRLHPPQAGEARRANHDVGSGTENPRRQGDDAQAPLWRGYLIR